MTKFADGTVDPRGTPAWRRLRAQCYERDRARGAVCHICKQPIDYSAKPSSTPNSYEPDHLRDVRKHPEFALLPENIDASHRRCNRARGRRAGLNILGTPSRDWSQGR